MRDSNPQGLVALRIQISNRLFPTWSMSEPIRTPTLKTRPSSRAQASVVIAQFVEEGREIPGGDRQVPFDSLLGHSLDADG